MKRPSLAPVKVPNRRRSPWKIELPASVSPTGKKARWFFPTKSEAEIFADKQKVRLANFGALGSSLLSPALAEQSAKAFELLKPYGVSLNEVVRDWISRRDAATATVSFATASEQYRAMLNRKKIRGRPVSDKYKRTTRNMLAAFSKFDPLPLTEIDSRMIAQAAEGMTAHMRNMGLAILSAFFGWCIETPRHWIMTNPAASVPRESTGGREVQTFTAPAVQKILAACDADDLLAYHVLGFFAGIRPEELERMRWEFIDLAENAIVLPAEITKTGRRRVVEINDTLAAWLKDLISRVGISKGAVVSPVNLRKRLRAVREASGVAWIQDGMRHTYASNWLAIHKDEHRLRDNMGHRSAEELWNHYHKATTTKDATAFWKIVPSKGAKVVAFKRGMAA